ncbi:probable bifunctional dTTP/UTP pyrophosphatase/methyltransferase protein [Amyelois transitella]|uniref:probable bifunctional dTTP/UTP pyrophosphatase/methyltransferase protein n=1 Tax=Amyelois transitella TaxID=680683 RepID=UPI00067C2897|nr:probable bifunctional dTTP/UTP pyrophosphatase/methyltransferase protein [Amyelois transitella]
MLQPVMHILKHKNIILASGSPRRKELIENIGLKVTLCPSKFEENLVPSDFNSFSEFVEETALQKALEVERRLTQEGRAPDMVIAADTMVTLDGQMFGKPQDQQEAFDMLSSLSGKGHTVYTGVVIKTNKDVVKFTENTKVFFGKIDEEQIKAYIATGEPMDKAGGYGIQGVGGTFVERVEGDYFTVVGFPLYRTTSILYNMFKNIENKLT